MAKPGKMTDHEKTKEAYSVHQDNLFWSRTQTLIAVQGGTLAGSYSVRTYPGLAIPLLLLGATLTIFIWLAAERDQDDRNLAFEQSHVPPLRTPAAGLGRLMMKCVFILLLVADIYLLGWLIIGYGWPTLGFLTS